MEDRVLKRVREAFPNDTIEIVDEDRKVMFNGQYVHIQYNVAESGIIGAIKVHTSLNIEDAMVESISEILVVYKRLQDDNL